MNNNKTKSVDVACYQTYICIYSCIFVCAILILSHFHMIVEKKMFYFIFYIETKMLQFFLPFHLFTHTLYRTDTAGCQKRVFFFCKRNSREKKSSLYEMLYIKSIVQTNIKKFVLYLILILRTHSLAFVI